MREAAIVFGLTVGLPFAGSMIADRGYDFGQRRLLTTLAVEAVAVALLWPWLRRRGWSFGRIAGDPIPLDVVRGFVLAFATYVAVSMAAVIWSALVPGGFEQITSAVPTGSAAPWVVVLVSVFNPIVEEFLWLAYGFTVFRRFGIGTAIAVTVGLRVLVHAYQGPMAVVGILPLGLVFTYYYARTGRIWPVVVAHMLFDVVGLLRVVRS